MAQVSPEAMIELMQTVNKTQSVQIDEQTKTIKELRELVAELRGLSPIWKRLSTNSSENFLAVPVRSFLRKKKRQKKILPRECPGKKEVAVTSHKRKY